MLTGQSLLHVVVRENIATNEHFFLSSFIIYSPMPMAHGPFDSAEKWWYNVAASMQLDLFFLAI